MPENFRMSVMSLKFKRQSQSYDVQAHQSNVVMPEDDQKSPIDSPYKKGYRFDEQEQQTNNENSQNQIRKVSVLKRSDSEKKPTHNDFWICTGILLVICLLCVIGALLIELRTCKYGRATKIVYVYQKDNLTATDVGTVDYAINNNNTIES